MGGLLLLAITLLAYLPALRAGFIWDDDYYVTNNPTLRSPDGLRQIWLGIFHPGPAKYVLPQYYPLVHTTFWLESRVWGLDDAAGFHAVNVVLHALSAVLLWRLLLKLNVPGAFLAATIFALHPVHVESVAWITERKNLLSGLLYLASAGCWLRFYSRRDSGRGRGCGVIVATYIFGLALFTLALLSKTVTASLPAALLLIRWWKSPWPDIRAFWRDLLPMLPLFALGAAAAGLTSWMEMHRVGAWGPEWNLSIPQRLLILGTAPAFYLGKLWWPNPLIFTYPRWSVERMSVIRLLAPPALLGGVLLGLWQWRRRIGRGVLVAAAYFLLTLLPALGLANVYPMRYSFVADHFQYLASIAPIALIAAALARGAESSRPAVRSMLRGLCAAGVLALGALTWRQCLMYRSAETLWRQTLADNPSAWMAHVNLGNLLASQGDLDGAESHYRQALVLKPDYATAAQNLGVLAERRGDLVAAGDWYVRALDIYPEHPPGSPGFRLRARFLYSLGRVWALSGDLDRAAALYQEALEADPEYEPSLTALAKIELDRSEFDSARLHLSRAIEVASTAPEPRVAMGDLLLRQGEPIAAAERFAQAQGLAPEDRLVANNIGVAYARSGDRATAARWFIRAVGIDPGYELAMRNWRSVSASTTGPAAVESTPTEPAKGD